MPADRSLRIGAEKVAFLPARRVTDDTSVLTLKNLVFEPLCRWRDGRALPGLFGHWEHDDAGRRWLFHIRDGAVFHDGKPCVADDVLAFIDGIVQSVDTFGMKWSYARYLADVSITARSALIVEVVSPHPFADILDVFSEFFICRETPDGRLILGTGPYRVVDTVDGKSATLRRVSGDGPEGLTLNAIPDAGERYRALRDGAIDAAMNLEHLDEPTGDPHFQWGQAVHTLSVIYYLNCTGGLFAARDARLAVNLAIDRKRLIDDLFHGLAVLASTIVSPHHLGFAEAALSPLRYDPDAARRLFDGCAHTGPIVIRTPRTMPERADRVSAAVAEALKAVGIDSRIDVQSDRPEYAREVGRKQMGDMAIFDSSPHSTYRVLDDKISSRTKAVWWQGYDDPEVERLIDEAHGAVAQDDRARAYGKCLSRLQANPPWLYLFHPIVVFAAAPQVRGLSLDAKGVLGVAS